ncbi:MAG: hypothetical protein H7126_09815 [Candidatus Parcubacteria bacterium]|uniref:hypothetical protein n=1 Tax=Phormidesmis priestleyi TaxID=268141 RepID=UPI000839FCF1|nr:hypothetical protein [Phormidesmis priestleyi]MBC7824164.1 hypothetical protein [Leptolyngbyaceae cyanobacterium LF-bin-113]
MASPTPLQGLDLVDCARANAKQGIETTADLCGYGKDLNTFRHELEKACQHMGVEFHELSDLIRDETPLMQMGGEIVAPDTPSEL